MWLLCGCIQWCVYSRSAQFRTVRARLYQSVYIAFVQSWNPIICPARLLTFTRSYDVRLCRVGRQSDNLLSVYRVSAVVRCVIFATFGHARNRFRNIFERLEMHTCIHACILSSAAKYIAYPQWYKYERACVGLQVNLFVQSNNGVE